MAQEKFVLMSLDEGKAQKIASVLTNETARKIMEFLADHDSATETDIVRNLTLAASTVNYNMKLLQESGLVVAEEFHYSGKGREVLHYKLANKYIIIAPQSKQRVPLNIRKLLGIGVFVAAIGAAIQFFNQRTEAIPTAQRSMIAEDSIEAFATQAVPVAAQSSNGWWFIAGGALALLLVGAFILWSKRRA